MTTPAIEVQGLRKSYGGQVALDDVDLAVSAGSVTALLGPNGAGKTTTVNFLSTLVRPDGGAGGRAARAVRPRGCRAQTAGHLLRPARFRTMVLLKVGIGGAAFSIHRRTPSVTG